VDSFESFSFFLLRAALEASDSLAFFAFVKTFIKEFL
jgi:hypothetical protein